MDWKGLLRSETEKTYRVTLGLIDMTDNDALNWKPSTGSNWMTTGQLLMHLTAACGVGFKQFVTKDFGFPEGVDPSTMSPDEMLPPAEKMPTIDSVEKARELILKDKQLAFEMLEKCSNERLDNEIAAAPWDPAEIILGVRLLQMVEHLKQHKGQLFYYLKLQGKPVNTMHLWPMAVGVE